VNNPREIIIAIDAMGGDYGPTTIIKGAFLASKKMSKIKFIFFGEKEKITPLLKKNKILNISEVVNTEQIITNDTKPTDALRKYKKSSMFKAIESIKSGASNAVVSSGNTGALMVISTVLIKIIKGISRPAIASVFPTKKSETVMLDLGANIECDDKNILDFAIMGKIFSKTVLGIKKPKIGLLNVGSEILKGNEIVKMSAKRLAKEKSIHFYGFIEGNDISKGLVDVVVTDGFTGNIALKTAEGISELYTDFLKSSFTDNLYSKMAYKVSLPVLKSLWDRVNPSKYNGAMLLGLNGIVVKSHGSSDDIGFANAVSVAYDLCINNFNEKIINDIKKNFK
jgi:glycerol-3-phosphate acyltransferase PlsX